jgi:hypothetical protein
MAPTSIEPPSSAERATSTKARASADVVDVTAKAGARKAAVTSPERLFWRAVVRTGGMFAASRERDRVEWHLVGCPVPHAEGSHCTEGLRLAETSGQPDGHCVIDGRCGRCGETARHVAIVRKAA